MVHLTIVCENTAGVSRGILGEHGLAVLIEREGDSWLLDTGQGHTLIHNARILKRDLKKLRAVFFSHGHFDHTGGAEALLGLTGPIEVHAHPDIFSERFSQRQVGGKSVRMPAGIPFAREHLEELGARFILETDFREVAPGLYLTGEVPRTSAFEHPDSRLVVLQDGQPVPDPLRDDQSLVIRTGDGLAVVLGCAHAGMINTLWHIAEQLPGEPIHTVIGGTHLFAAGPEQLDESIAWLEKLDVARIGVSHCTGQTAAAVMHQRLGERFFFATAGTAISLP